MMDSSLTKPGSSVIGELKEDEYFSGMTGLLKDEHEVLQIYRKAKRLRYADMVITIQEGTRVKLWLTEKMK